MGAYDFNFDLPAGETLVPRADRRRALQALLPPAQFALAPVVTDRAAWSPWQNHPFGQRMLQTARTLAAVPYPEYTDAMHLACLENQDSAAINASVTTLRKRQIAFLLAEAIYDQGEFIPAIEDDLRQLSHLRTWIHPGNDLQRLNYDLKTVESDLGVLHYAENFALADFVLGPRLSPAHRALLREQLNRRVFQPLRSRVEAGRDIYWWITVKHNWCAAGLNACAHAAAALLPEAADRAWWLAFAEAQVKNFRDSIPDDGLSPEGVGYWSYSFMSYLSLSELLNFATGGVIDLLDEAKMARCGRFGTRAEIQPGVFPAFADCDLNIKPQAWISHWLDNRRGPPDFPVVAIAGADPFADMYLEFADEPLLWMFRARDPRQIFRAAGAPALRNWFENSALLICRPGPATARRFSATLLGGNNGMNHNHNDVGTFTVVLDGRTLVLDPGREIYSFRTFSAQRYDSPLLNSYGHPVPRVAGRLQEPGPAARARVVSREFSDDFDRIVLDLRAAYDVPALKTLEREFLYDRRAAGSLTVTDRVVFTSRETFEAALVTLGSATIDGDTVRLTDGDAALEAEVSLDAGEPLITTELIDQPPRPTRIALTCPTPVLQATIKVVLRPV